MMSFECLHCGEMVTDTACYDGLGWHTACADCDSSFDIDIEGDYLVSLRPHEPGRPAGAQPEHHRILEQFAFYKTDTIRECRDLREKLNEFEGAAYELYEVSSGRVTASGVFTEESICHALRHTAQMNEDQKPDTGMEMR